MWTWTIDESLITKSKRSSVVFSGLTTMMPGNCSDSIGFCVITSVICSVGCFVGTSVANWVADSVGLWVADSVGDSVADWVGDSVDVGVASIALI